MTIGSSSSKALLNTAEVARKEFSRALKALNDAKIKYHDRAPELPQHLIENCKLIRNRHELIRLLPKHAVVAEIGTDQGIFARFLLESCEPKELHLFEIDPTRIVAANIEDGLKQNIVRIHAGSSAEMLQKMPDHYFDWIYIDGDHKYEGVKLDIEVAAIKVRPGGFLVFNDYNTWSPTTMSRCGVARAVNEFCIASNWEFAYLAFQSMMYNDVAIRKA